MSLVKFRMASQCNVSVMLLCYMVGGVLTTVRVVSVKDSFHPGTSKCELAIILPPLFLSANDRVSRWQEMRPQTRRQIALQSSLRDDHSTPRDLLR